MVAALEVRHLEAEATKQEYLRLLGDSIFDLQSLVAAALGLKTWGSLATKLLLENGSPQKPWRAKTAGALQAMGLDISVQESLGQVASPYNNYCHPGSTVSNSYLYALAMDTKLPGSLAMHRPNVIKVMKLLKSENLPS